MKTHTGLDPETLHADTWSLRLRVMTLAYVVCDFFESLLDRHWTIVLREVVRHLASDVRGLIVDIAVATAPRGAPRRRMLYPGAPPPGFRRARRVPSAMRRFKRVVRLRGRTPGARLRWLRHVFLNLKRWLTRLHARFRALKPVDAFILIAPVVATPVAFSTPAPLGADTS